MAKATKPRLEPDAPPGYYRVAPGQEFPTRSVRFRAAGWGQGPPAPDVVQLALPLGGEAATTGAGGEEAPRSSP